MDIIIGIFAIMGGTILLLLNQNKRLRSDKKLSDLKIEDSKLQEQAKTVKDEKSKLKKELNTPVETKQLTDEEIESFWKERKK